MPSMPALSLRGIRLPYGAGQALVAAKLEVARGEVHALLGPASSGKTALLRMAAGLAAPETGSVLLQGRDIARRPAAAGRAALVLKGGMLYPRMDVWHNVACSLRIHPGSARDLQKNVARALEAAGLKGREGCLPEELSAAERLRASLARALVLEPCVLLLDEPFLSLEAAQKPPEIKNLRNLAENREMAVVIATRSAADALAASDRISLLRAGRLLGTGTPDELFRRPGTVCAARTVGDANLISGRVVAMDEGELLLDIGGVTVPCSSEDWVSLNEKLWLCIRPQRLCYGTEAPRRAFFLGGTFQGFVYSGGERSAVITLITGLPLLAREPSCAHREPEPGKPVFVWWDRRDASVVRDDRDGHEPVAFPGAEEAS